ncbi:MAG TPA: hypothetical protein VM553_21990 [Dongiaceae bacterium]|nr:hypothetical protein [Dongiaceae bacterium]
MKRLYYLFRGTQPAKAISDDLHDVGLNDGQLHFMSKDAGSLQLAKVHTTSLFQERDLQHSGTYGAIIGLGIGVLFASYLMASELGHYMNVWAFLFVCVMFTFHGAWIGGIVGISHDNHHIARFHEALEQGDTLMMVDAYTPQQENRARNTMHSRHLEASFEGEDKEYREFF